MHPKAPDFVPRITRAHSFEGGAERHRARASLPRSRTEHPQVGSTNRSPVPYKSVSASCTRSGDSTLAPSTSSRPAFGGMRAPPSILAGAFVERQRRRAYAVGPDEAHTHRATRCLPDLLTFFRSAGCVATTEGGGIEAVLTAFIRRTGSDRATRHRETVVGTAPRSAHRPGRVVRTTPRRRWDQRRSPI